MLFADINPFIRFARNEHISALRNNITYCAYDSRIFICTNGHGKITVNETSYEMKPGALLMWRGGERYVYNTPDFMALSGCNFDFTSNKMYLDVAILPSVNTALKKEALTESIHIEDVAAFNGVIYMENMQCLIPLMKNIITEFSERKLFFEKQCSGMLTQIFSHIARASGAGVKASTQKKADEIIAYIRKHYPEKIDNKTLGEVFNYHPNYINKIMVNCTGMSLHNYLLTYRINTAIHLLQSCEMSVSEVASAVGFCDVMYFSKYFKQKTGKCPSSYTTKK